MADEYQSSNQLIGKLNAQENILARGVVELEMNAATVGYSGFKTIDINYILATVANPTFEVYEYIEAGGPGYQKYLVKSPRTLVDTFTGNVLFTSNNELYWDMGKTGVSVVISAWHRTDNTPRVFYYLVKGTSITGGDVFTP